MLQLFGPLHRQYPWKSGRKVLKCSGLFVGNEESAQSYLALSFSDPGPNRGTSRPFLSKTREKAPCTKILFGTSQGPGQGYPDF